MKTIREIKKRIENELSPEIEKFGLVKAKDFVFWHKESDVTKIVELSFLRKADASYFGSTTASFSIRFGGLYGQSEFEQQKDFPAEYFCQIRGVLNRDFYQKAPNSTLSDIEHKRRDIWWIENSDLSVQMVIDGAKRVIDNELGIWLDQLDDRKYLCNILHNEDEKMQTGLWGFGGKASPARLEAIKKICSDVNIDKFVKNRNPFNLFLKWLTKKRVDHKS